MGRDEKDHKQIQPSGGCTNGKNLRQQSAKQTLTPPKGKKNRPDSVIFEEGDLRGIVAEGLAESIDPYEALLRAGVIKKAAEFFNNDR